MKPAVTDKFIILDRDGTLLKEPEDFQIDSFQKFQFLDGVLEALIDFRNQGYRFIMITNQDGLGTEKNSVEKFNDIQRVLLETLASIGVIFDDIGICPHFAEEGCQCRKPELSLLPAQIKLGLYDCERSFVVGDRQTDIQLAKNLGIRGYNCSELSWGEIRQLSRQDTFWQIDRATKETSIKMKLLNRRGDNKISTGLPFFDHMLDAMMRFSGLSLSIEAKGDLETGSHHLVEDVALCLGKLFFQRLQDKRGIRRYAQWTPMDEALSKLSLDISGRGHFEFFGEIKAGQIAGVEIEMFLHFFKTLSHEMGVSLILETQGINSHHQVESLFKGMGLCLQRALKTTGDNWLPSTKGAL